MPNLDFDNIRFWLGEIESCKRRQDDELKRRNNYPLTIKYYEGEQGTDQHLNEQTPTATDRIKKLAVLNEYFPNVNELIANISFRDLEITTEATKPVAPAVDPLMPEINVEDNAPIMKAALKYGFEKLGGDTENRIALFDKILAGYSATEVNYFVDHPPVKPKEGETRSFVERVKNIMKPEEDLERDLPPKEQPPIKGKSFIRRWNPLDILLDYRAERVSDLRYIIKIIKMSHAEFKAKYPLFGDIVTASEIIPFSQHKDETHRKSVIVYEIQQKKKDTYVTFMITPSIKTQEIDYFERPYPANGFNVKIGVLHEYGVLYSISFGQINKASQDDTNNYLTHWMEVAERNIPKRGYNKNKLKEDGKKALNSNKTMDAVPCDGGAETVWPIPHSPMANENREVFGILREHKDKTWAQSEARTSGKAVKPTFAEELKIQEAGFQVRQVDIQQGLRRDLRAQLDTLKDIIVTFWDDAMWFKITGGQKPTWYVPDVRRAPDGSETLINPLNEVLTQDYEVDIDVTSALRSNKAQRKAELIEYLTWVIGTASTVLQMHGKIVSLDLIEKSAREFGFNPKNLFVDITPQQQQLIAAQTEEK